MDEKINIGGNNAHSYNGYMSDIRIYDVALTQSNIEDIYAQKITGEYIKLDIDENNLINWYKFNDISNKGIDSKFLNNLITTSKQIEKIGIKNILNNLNVVYEIPSSVNITGDIFSIALWFSIVDEDEIIFCIKNSVDTKILELTIKKDNNTIEITYNEIEPVIYTIPTSISLIELHHLVYIYDISSDGWELYIDNIKQTTNNVFPTIEEDILIETTKYIGDNDNKCNCYLEDYRIYNRRLMEFEITKLYEQKTTNEYYINPDEN